VRVVGVDPGLAACGWGVVEARGSRSRSLGYGCWTTEPGLALAVRLESLFGALGELLAEYRPDALVLEESFVGLDAQTALRVGQVRGALLLAGATAAVPCLEHTPAQVKQAVTGYGRAEKRQVQQMVKARLGLREPPTPTHAADALAVAICHAQAPPLTRFGRRASRRQLNKQKGSR
jgi:crossover junction endodeoxyribonuclease RuvC